MNLNKTQKPNNVTVNVSMIEEYDDQDNGDQIPNSLQKGKNTQILG